MTDTTFAILIYGFVLAMYCLGTWATWRAEDAVRKMDRDDQARSNIPKETSPT